MLVPARAAACSCRSDRHGGSDPYLQLADAAVAADAIFVGHVLKTTGPDAHGHYAHGTAILRVTEVFKGELEVGADVAMPAGDASGDCSLVYEPDSDVLVYATRSGGSLTAGLCSRTRTLTAGKPDLELGWLRGGMRPMTPPVVLQRERVVCDRCTVSTVGLALTGMSYPGCCGAESSGIAEALRTKKPFWAGGYYEREDPRHQLAVGVTKDGTPFQLVETVDPYPDQACTGRVELRKCRGLEPDKLTATCLSPGKLEPVCDETRSRKTSFDPLEDVGTTNCDWRGLDDVQCDLPRTPTPLKTSSPAWPRLVCAPQRPESFEAEPRQYICNLAYGPTAPAPQGASSR